MTQVVLVSFVLTGEPCSHTQALSQRHFGLERPSTVTENAGYFCFTLHYLGTSFKKPNFQI